MSGGVHLPKIPNARGSYRKNFWGLDPKDRIKLGSEVVDGGCWIWKRNKRETGYATISFGGKQRYVHVLSYLAFIGSIPPDHDVDHTCWNTDCVNPAHLRVLPYGINRALTKKRADGVCKRGHRIVGDNVRVLKARLNGGENKIRCRACCLLIAKRARERRAK